MGFYFILEILISKKSVVHSCDVVEAILIVLKKWNQASGKVFNVAYPKALSLEDIEFLFSKLNPKKFFLKLKLKGIVLFLLNIANILLSKLTKKKINLEYIQESSVIDSGRIQKELGFRFKTDFEKGIESILK